jgi:GAF domain-containing protein
MGNYHGPGGRADLHGRARRDRGEEVRGGAAEPPGRAGSVTAGGNARRSRGRVRRGGRCRGRGSRQAALCRGSQSGALRARGTWQVVGEWGRGTAPPLHTGARLELDDSTAVGRVYCTGKPAHTTASARPEGSRPARLNERGYQSSYAAPIYVERNLWGALALADVGEEPLAEGSEQRLARFSELVAQAIANGDARAQLAASRARQVGASDAERRRLERNLHDGAQQRLQVLSLTMRLAHQSLPGDPLRPTA